MGHSDKIKLDQLKYFVAAVETGSFVSAGKRLNITPTSISHAVSAIENATGTDLLVRRRATGVIPNRDGKRFLSAARKVLLEFEYLSNEFNQKDASLSGELIVGAQEGLTWSLAPHATRSMSRLYPDVRVSTKTVFMDEHLKPLEDGSVDVLLTFIIEPIDDPNIFAERLCHPQPYVMMREGHPVAETRSDNQVALAGLAEYPHIFIDDGPAFGLFESMYTDRGLKPNVYMVSNVSPGVQAMVGKSDIISIRIVRPSIHLSPLGDPLTYRKLSDEVTRPELVALTLRNSQSRISRRSEAFIDCCRQNFADGTLADNFFY